MNTLNQPKVLRAWAFYDWANSVHSLTITSAIFPIYFPIAAIMLRDGKESKIVSFLGYDILNTALYSYTISFALLLLSISMPILSGIVDFTGKKKQMMRFFCYLGSLSCIALFFFTPGRYYLGTFAFLFSIIGWGGSIVFYNSYLPEIASPDKFDQLSARGFTYGYVGSVLLLIQNLTMVLKPEWYGNIDGGLASRISFLTVGLWWFLFSHVSFHYLPTSKSKVRTTKNWWLGGYYELNRVFEEIKQTASIKQFLLSFFLFNMGAQTVMYLGALFGSEELKLPTDSLIITILLIQLVAIPGAYICAFLSRKFGNVQALIIIVCIWIIICGFAYTVKDKLNFYLLATCIGFVMGGIQSNSRSTFAKLCPIDEKDTASYFSLYDVCDRLSTVIGTFIFGLVIQLTGNMRLGILILAFVFAFSLLFLRALFLYKTPALKSV